MHSSIIYFYIIMLILVGYTLIYVIKRNKNLKLYICLIVGGILITSILGFGTLPFTANDKKIMLSAYSNYRKDFHLGFILLEGFMLIMSSILIIKKMIKNKRIDNKAFFKCIVGRIIIIFLILFLLLTSGGQVGLMMTNATSKGLLNYKIYYYITNILPMIIFSINIFIILIANNLIDDKGKKEEEIQDGTKINLTTMEQKKI